jgi:hypothetical protein
MSVGGGHALKFWRGGAGSRAKYCGPGLLQNSKPAANLFAVPRRKGPVADFLKSA